MCGIFGWLGVSPKDSTVLFKTLSRMLHHRGPDDQGFEQGLSWGLGFRRLSILDLSPLGHQPMSSLDKRYWIVFNGEIYNYIELRRILESQGEIFQSGSDTEVLLRLLMREGPRALKRVNGMFSFAFVDTNERTFLLARDRLGKKPLYYCFQPGQLRFASELKALLAWDGASRQLNLKAVAEYLAIGYLPGETCIFEGYEKLPPAHYLQGSLDYPERSTPASYWSLTLSEQIGHVALSDGDLAELTDLLTNAVDIRLRSDVPVGIFLSGGIDSGLVTSIAARSQVAHPLALTLSFEENDYNEQAQAEATVQHIGLEHRVIKQQQGGLADIDRLAWFYDEPFGDASALPTMTLCRAASQHATVFLSGDGGDETFGGYQRYINAGKYAWLKNLPNSILHGIRLLSKLMSINSSLRYKMIKSSYPDVGMAAVFDGQGIAEDPILQAVVRPLLKEQLRKGGDPIWRRWEATQGKPLLTRQQTLDFALYLPDDILVKADRASMANSIELRSPLLDYRLVEWAARLPRNVFLNTIMGKLPLRIISEKMLPQKIQQGKKRGFGVPLGDWFRSTKGKNFARERLLSHESLRRGLLDAQGVDQILLMHTSGNGRNLGEYIWRLLMLDAWARQYLDEPTFLKGPPNT